MCVGYLSLTGRFAVFTGRVVVADLLRPQSGARFVQDVRDPLLSYGTLLRLAGHRRTSRFLSYKKRNKKKKINKCQMCLR